VRTIFSKVMLWSLGTFLLSLIAFWAISRALERPGPPKGDPFPHFLEMVEDDLCRAYEKGGRDELAASLRRLDGYLPGEHLLTDECGRDLATGRDRSDLLGKGETFSLGPPRLPDGRMVFIGPPRDPRYRFISVVQPWFDRPNILPYYGAIVLVIALMGWILAAHLAAPLRRLRRLVDQFGHGNLTARAHSTRKDEIGELSRSFDEMAGRIETLLSAERRLLQDVSHELRSPLTRLDVAVDLASTSDEPGEFLGRIKRDIGRLSVLVNELLQLTRAEGDPAAHALEDVRLDDLLHGLIEDCEVEAEANGCSLILSRSQPAAIRGEPELLHRAVENVVRNAIRHAPHGTAVDVSLELHGGVATIVVRDHGPGVPDDRLGAIFEPFYRVEGDRSRASGGVGLGLAIARRAVELHQGRISAQNAGPGLMVKIELPRGTSPPSSNSAEAAMASAARLLAPSGNPFPPLRRGGQGG
jgi:two-component system sensor histidine kinase CpxA